MNDKAGFASLLAQVIPVVLIAVIVESREAHRERRQRSAANASDTWRGGRVIRGLAWETVLLTLLVFLEAAALFTAEGRQWLAWFAGIPGAVAVSVLLALATLIYVQTLGVGYRSDVVITEAELRSLSLGIYGLMAAVVAAGAAALICFLIA